MENGYRPGEPLSVSEQAAFSEVALDILASSHESRPHWSMACSEPGDSFFIRSIDGTKVTFYIQKVPFQQHVQPNQSVFMGVLNPGQLSGVSELILFGASEIATMQPHNMGTIEQYADLVYAPVRRQPVWLEDRANEEEYQRMLESGEIIRTPMADMRLEVGAMQVMPAILDLALVDESGRLDYVFEHK